MTQTSKFTVFTKPWKNDTLEALADRVAGLGFQGIELPVRDGFQVNPDNFRAALPKAVSVLGQKNISIESIAGAIETDLVKAMGHSGVKILRIMLGADPKKNYLKQEETYYKTVSELLPVLESSGVRLGVQNHCGNFLGSSSAGLMRFVGRFPKTLVGAVLDLAHCAVAGEIPEFALDIAASHLVMVNIKNGRWQRINAESENEAIGKIIWTSGCDGTLSWKLAAEELRRRNYGVPICFTAEYSDKDRHFEGEESAALIIKDIQYWNTLLMRNEE